jgi:hypothetical protein
MDEKTTIDAHRVGSRPGDDVGSVTSRKVSAASQVPGRGDMRTPWPRPNLRALTVAFDRAG